MSHILSSGLRQIRIGACKDIVEARATSDRRIFIRFEDGVEGEVDLADLVSFRGVFASLREPEEFRKVEVNTDLGTVCWPSGPDLDPGVLYSKLTGQSIRVADSNPVGR